MSSSSSTSSQNSSPQTSTPPTMESEWKIAKNKKVKASRRKITFKRQMGNSLWRGISLSEDAFHRMEDISISPNLSIELGKHMVLSNYGKIIKLTKYCSTRDEKRCDGAFFIFTEEEWQYFWNSLRKKICNHFQR